MRKKLSKALAVASIVAMFSTLNIFAAAGSYINIKTEPIWNATSTKITRGKIGVVEENNLYYINFNGEKISNIGNLTLIANDRGYDEIVDIGDFEKNFARITFEDGTTWAYHLAGKRLMNLNDAMNNYENGFEAADIFGEGLLGGKTDTIGDYPFFNENGELLEFTDSNFNINFKTSRNNNEKAKYTLIEVDDTFSNGLIWFKALDKEENTVFGYMDKTGKIVIEPIYEDAGRFGQELAPVIQDGKVKYINKIGNVVVNTEYKEFNHNNNGSVFAENFDTVTRTKGGLWGVVDKNGRCTTGFISEIPIIYYGEMAIIKVDGKYGYVNQFGDIAIEPIYDQAFNFTRDATFCALVRYGEDWFLIKQDGSNVNKKIWHFEDAFAFESLPNAIMYKQNGLWGLGRIEFTN